MGRGNVVVCGVSQITASFLPILDSDMGRRIWLAASALAVLTLLGGLAMGTSIVRALDVAVQRQSATARAMLVTPQQLTTEAAARVAVRTLERPGLAVRIENHDAGFAVRGTGDGAITAESIPVRPRNAAPPRGMQPGQPLGQPPDQPPGAPPPHPPSMIVGVALSLARVAPARIRAEPLLIAVEVDGATLASDLVMVAFGTLGVIIVIAGAAWALAASFERAALAPLLQTTDALEALASGDFSPRTIETRGSPHIERLARAYNAAAQHVAHSFDERRKAAQEFQRFLADAGHELRTPLTIVSGYMEIIRDISALDEITRERVLRSMRAETDRMRSLVEKMLLLARMESPVAHPRAIDIDASVADVVHALRGRHPERSIVMQSVNADTRYAMLDEDDLYEALFNLVENALRYAPDSDVLVETASDSECVRIAVVDHGPGISPQDRAHIFERFFRGSDREATEGSGLGLAIVKRAVERWNGTITLESGDGETRFVLKFPRLKEAA